VVIQFDLRPHYKESAGVKVTRGEFLLFLCITHVPSYVNPGPNFDLYTPILLVQYCGVDFKKRRKIWKMNYFGPFHFDKY
jgi:hypothetical protein